MPLNWNAQIHSLVNHLTFRNLSFTTVLFLKIPMPVLKTITLRARSDLVAVKSWWDQYSIATARPSSNIIMKRLSGITPTCSGVGIGSEMSGEISNVTIGERYE